MKVIDQVVTDRYSIYHSDCIDVLRALPSDSVHYSVFSPPFSSLFTYSASPRDIGNVKNDAEFFAHFGFLLPELYRVMKPGRLLSMHCMLLPTSKERDGYIGLRDFRGDLVYAAQRAGFIFHSEVAIWKDPVTAMQRTKALGLLHKTIRKDSSMSRQGINDYIVTLRKPGANDEPIAHVEGTESALPVALWQQYASPVWATCEQLEDAALRDGFYGITAQEVAGDDSSGINPSNTLQRESAREAEDERHIAPLQLEVIRRCVRLWSNPGDVVLSPFAGIGSEGFVALKEGRRFVGAELKRSYYQQAALNLAAASQVDRQQSLFGLMQGATP